jgi:SET domain-containing protein
MDTNLKIVINLPHYKVFTRIGRSEIHGAGVIAIRYIKKGTYIFYGDDQPIRWVNAKKLKRLPNEIKKLYKDFCIFKDNCYGCPINFNLLTPAWYINHSVNPNVACDQEYNFYAIRNIKEGEELTADYNAYSRTQFITGSK